MDSASEPLGPGCFPTLSDCDPVSKEMPSEDYPLTPCPPLLAGEGAFSLCLGTGDFFWVAWPLQGADRDF